VKRSEVGKVIQAANSISGENQYLKRGVKVTPAKLERWERDMKKSSNRVGVQKTLAIPQSG